MKNKKQKVARNAWLPGSVWKSTGGEWTAIIVGPSNRPNYKIVRMENNNPWSRVDVVRSDYSRAHMLRYFTPTYEIKSIPPVTGEGNDKYLDFEIQKETEQK